MCSPEAAACADGAKMMPGSGRLDQVVTRTVILGAALRPENAMHPQGTPGGIGHASGVRARGDGDGPNGGSPNGGSLAH